MPTKKQLKKRVKALKKDIKYFQHDIEELTDSLDGLTNEFRDLRSAFLDHAGQQTTDPSCTTDPQTPTQVLEDAVRERESKEGDAELSPQELLDDVALADNAAHEA